MVLARNISLAGIVIVGVTFVVMYARRRRPVDGGASEAAPAGGGSPDAGKRFMDLVEQNPEAIARLLAAWIDEPASADAVKVPMAA